MKKIIYLLGIAVIAASCTIHENIDLKTDNSVDRIMDVTLDTASARKIMAFNNQNNSSSSQLDSLNIVWDSIAVYMGKNVKEIPGATFSASDWNSNTKSGQMKYHFPNIESYNKITATSFNPPGNKTESAMPSQKHSIEWRGKDTLLITYDNSTPLENGQSIQEVQQGIGFLKMLMGVDTLMKYSANFQLPRKAKNVYGEGAQLSPDKKTLHIEKMLEDVNEPDSPSIIKIVF